jgi:hypothetical protein
MKLVSIKILPNKTITKDDICVLSEKTAEKLNIVTGDFILIEGVSIPFLQVLVLPVVKSSGLLVSQKVFLSTGKHNFLKTIKANNLIGTDPEFFLVHRKVGQKDYSIPAEYILGKKYSDGDLGEIRPDPSSSVEGLLDNIEKSLIEVSSKINNNFMLVGSSFEFGLSAGFHLHFNLPENLKFIEHGTISNNIIKGIVKLLDSSVGLISRLDIKSKQRINSNEKFGRLGDYKLNIRTLEYRVPGAFWLRSRSLSKFLLEYSKNTFDKIITESYEATNAWSESAELGELRKKLKLPNEIQTKNLYKDGLKKTDVEVLVGNISNIPRISSDNILQNWRVRGKLCTTVN